MKIVRNIMFVALPCVALFACGTHIFTAQESYEAKTPHKMWYYKPGMTAEQRSNDMLSCRMAASNIVGQRLKTYQNPYRYTTIQTQCSRNPFNIADTSVTCTQTGGKVYGGEIEQYDANSNLRNEYLNNCLMQKGYLIDVDIPACPKGIDIQSQEKDKHFPQNIDRTCWAPKAGYEGDVSMNHIIIGAY